MTVSSSRVAIFRADASSVVGGGHVMRCLTLADGLAAAGWSVGFAVASGTTAVVPRLGERPDVLEADRADLAPAALSRRWPAGCDVLVVDHYGLDARFESACRGWARRIVVVDDLADRPHDCDLLVDATLGRAVADYAGLAPPAALVLAGADYALLRPAFVALREEALPRRAARERVERVLVTLGLTDLGAVTEQVVRALLELPAELSIDVVIGAAAAGRGALAALAAGEPAVRLHVDPSNLDALMAQADLAIGAGGTTSWERCCLGLPTILLILADNQRLVAARLEAAGAAVGTAADRDAIVAVSRSLIADAAALHRMARAAAAIIDGRGTGRVVVAIAGLAASPDPSGPMKLRLAIRRDSESVWTWRNDPESRARSRDTAAVPWVDHDRWFERTLRDPGRLMLIGVVAGEPVGVVRFDRSAETHAVVSINLAAEKRGAGLGAKLLGAACSAFAEHVPHTPLSAEIRIDNVASRRVFEACGFVAVDAEDGFAVYRRHD